MFSYDNNLSFFTNLDIYILCIIDIISKDSGISQNDLYALSLINIIRNSLVYFFLIFISFLGSIKSKIKPFKILLFSLIPLIIYWGFSFYFRYRFYPIGDAYDILFCTSIFLLEISIYCKKFDKQILIPTGIKRSKLSIIIVFLFFIAYFIVLPYILSFLLPSYIKNYRIAVNKPNLVLLIVIFIYAFIISFTEELFYRGILFNYLAENTDIYRAIIISSLFFA